MAEILGCCKIDVGFLDHELWNNALECEVVFPPCILYLFQSPFLPLSAYSFLFRSTTFCFGFRARIKMYSSAEIRPKLFHELELDSKRVAWT
ncbi:hypothetical protein Y032_0373g183 [Ancylostoma ceylanicum]|uniref:Uncharacterized protein n=1 Tax=Ancylostoma ceylanicum TaxID=53326 RepID=A0A016RUM9_9BILA|nr:hypothetical protein Y032_0373g183 [Ancylostoma ceylanicum]